MARREQEPWCWRQPKVIGFKFSTLPQTEFAYNSSVQGTKSQPPLWVSAKIYLDVIDLHVDKHVSHDSVGVSNHIMDF